VTEPGSNCFKAKNLIVILGPTASGKTRLAVAAAELLGGEIISADSRQVFRLMDIAPARIWMSMALFRIISLMS